MKLICVINLFVFATLLSNKATAGDVYVNNLTGNDSRNGSSAEQAVLTLKKAVQLCSAGDTLHLANTGKEYRESLNFGSHGGTPSSPIIVEGNGAVLSGLTPLPAEQWQDKGSGLYFFSCDVRKQMPAARPYIFLNGQMVPRQKTPEQVTVEGSHMNKEGFYFRVADGKKITDYKLEATGRISGVILSGASYIEVRNLICERFANDGFNVHGSCQGLVFRNIVGRWNGDDGFSIHEDVGAVVLGGHFHHNDYGIQDINISRSTFYGVLVENNRQAGADFYGGVRTIFDSVMRNNNGSQIQLSQDRTKHMRSLSNSPATDGLLILKNTLTIGGDTGIAVRDGRADISNCSIVGAEEGIVIGEDADVEMICSAVYGCRSKELACNSATSKFDANLYASGRISWKGKSYEPGSFESYQTDSGQDAGSAVSSALHVAKAEGFRLIGKSLSYGRHHIQPGIETDLSFPFGDPIRNTLEGFEVNDGSNQQFDFETANPWCLVYPSPEKNKAGQPVTGTAELSEEQSRSGKRSVKLDVTFPADHPGPWLVKLFSVRLPAPRPVAAIKFAMYGDNSGMSYQPRIRDCTGECFYGPAGKVDWQGWKEIAWNLKENVPDPVCNGDGNKKQDGPTMEIVLEIKPDVPAQGGHTVLYLDDLNVLLEK